MTIPGSLPADPATDPANWAIYVRDAALSLVAEVDDYQRLDATLRFNDVGTWVLDLDDTVSAAEHLRSTGAGIVVTKSGVPVFSGPVRRRQRKRGELTDRLVVAGPDDLSWLTRRVAHPQPATAAPPYNTNAYDNRTGVCSTVLRAYVNANAGGGALAARQVTGLTLGTDPVAGSNVTGQARWQNLLTLLQELALSGGDLGFTLTQDGTDLVFDVYTPTDRSAEIVFSEELENLASFDYDIEGPTANYIVCGGGGEGTARTIVEGSDAASIAVWGRIETFRDRRDTTVAGELTQTITQELAEQAERTSFTVDPIELAQMMWLEHYNLGDQVTTVVEGVSFVEVVRAVDITIAPDHEVRIKPRISTPRRDSVLRLMSTVRALERRIADLERR